MNPPSSPLSPEPPVRCWCGHASLEDFSPDYQRCPECQTLVLRHMRGEEISQVRDDDRDFYGKNYYLRHVQEDYGLPDLETRTRTDLPERCLHWLRTLLKFVPGPGAHTLELGCGHGGFVAMQRWAGLDATGLELSPWLVRQARDWFGVPVLEGRLEDQNLPAASLDAVVLMDVLEHLPDPRATLGRAAALLRCPESFLLIQTPCYPAGMSYEELRAQNHAFLTQLKPQEHLYLFSEQAVARLCAELGVGQVRFEPAIYAHYDLFAVASAAPLTERPPSERAPMLLAASPPARWTLAMLDLAGERDGFSARLAAAAADLTDLRQKADAQNGEISRLHGVAGELWPKLDAAENARNLAVAQLADLQRNFEGLEADSAARLRVIATQDAEINRLCAEADRWQNEANLRAAQLDDLRGHFERSEADRAARGLLLETQGAELSRLHAEVDRWLREAGELRPQWEAARHEANLRAAQLDDLRGHFERSEADRAARGLLLETQGAELSRLHAEVDRWLREAGELRPQWEAARHEANLRAAQLDDLRGHFERSEADRAARLEVILSQGETVGRLQAQLAAGEAERARLAAEIDRRHEAHGALQATLGELQARHDALRTAHEGLLANEGARQAVHDALHARHSKLWNEHAALQTAHASLASEYGAMRARKKQLDRHWTSWLLKRLRLQPR